MIARRHLRLLLLLLPLLAQAQDVRIGVLGLFKPQRLVISALPASAVVVTTGAGEFSLDASSGNSSAELQVEGDALILRAGSQIGRASSVQAAGRDGGAVSFVLSIPGKIHRRYFGTLEVHARAGRAVPVVTMDLETAVASIVAAENLPGTPLEAMKAQAVVSRSYLLAARNRHSDFDFCDTTHCQFLREPPPPASAASRAAQSTRGLVLAYHDQPFAAMFTRSCGGTARTPAQVGMETGPYPYFPVECPYCRQHPVRWTRRVSEQDAARLRRGGELARLEIARLSGWDAVPSNNFREKPVDRAVLLVGTGEGHGIGLCQRGARAMAADGFSFRQILAHYFPNTTLITAAPGLQRAAAF
jgi:peptidoglycan hydrolase-like amidase